MQTYTPAKLGSKRTRTPEGFLICRDVAMARTGEMIYGPGETPIPVGPDGVARIERLPEVVFDPDTMASFVGKDVTYKHPPTPVDPDNWREVTAGTILAVRRGEGHMSDFMMGDIIVKDADTIAAIENDTLEVSNGYDAAYEQIAPGRGRQTKIVGNHLAILPKGTKGRCGSMCYVGDQAMEIEEPNMTVKPEGAGVALIKKLFGAKDDAAVQAVLDEAAANEQAQLVAAKDAQISDLTAKVAELTAALDDAKKAPTLDAAAVMALHARTAASAEILAPGTKLATFDAASDLTATVDHICACQRATLEKAATTDKGRAVVSSIIGDKQVSALTADELGSAFFAASGAFAALNNEVVARSVMSAAAMNPMADQYDALRRADEASRKRWAKPGQAA